MNKKQAIKQTEIYRKGGQGRLKLFDYLYALGEIKSEIKHAVVKGKYECDEYFFDLTPKTVKAIIKHFTKKGFTVNYTVTDGREQTFHINWKVVKPVEEPSNLITYDA